MLAGMAPALREGLKVPILCTLSGEDIFLEQLAEPHYSQARALLKQQARADRSVRCAESSISPTSWRTISTWIATRSKSFRTG